VWRGGEGGKGKVHLDLRCKCVRGKKHDLTLNTLGSVNKSKVLASEKKDVSSTKRKKHTSKCLKKGKGKRMVASDRKKKSMSLWGETKGRRKLKGRGQPPGERKLRKKNKIWYKLRLGEERKRGDAESSRGQRGRGKYSMGEKKRHYQCT